MRGESEGRGSRGVLSQNFGTCRTSVERACVQFCTQFWNNIVKKMIAWKKKRLRCQEHIAWTHSTLLTLQSPSSRNRWIDHLIIFEGKRRTRSSTQVVLSIRHWEKANFMGLIWVICFVFPDLEVRNLLIYPFLNLYLPPWTHMNNINFKKKTIDPWKQHI